MAHADDEPVVPTRAATELVQAPFVHYAEPPPPPPARVPGPVSTVEHFALPPPPPSVAPLPTFHSHMAPPPPHVHRRVPAAPPAHRDPCPACGMG